MKAPRRPSAARNRAPRFPLHLLGVAVLLAVFLLVVGAMGRPLAAILMTVFLGFVLLSAIIRPRSAEDESDWGHLENHRRARVWRAIRRLRERGTPRKR